MEKFDMKTREYEFRILEEPSKDNNYTCTCAGSLFSNKIDTELSIITMTPDDLPDSVEGNHGLCHKTEMQDRFTTPSSGMDAYDKDSV